MKMKLLVTLSVLFIPCSAFATGWYSDFTVSELQYSLGADGVHIVFSGGSGDTNPDNCANSSKFIIPYTHTSQERATAMLSGISMAYATKTNVRVLLSGCLAGMGGSTYPKVHYLFVK